VGGCLGYFLNKTTKKRLKMAKKKIKPIMPSLREKKRYLVFEIISKQKMEDFKLVSYTIWEKVLQFLGSLHTGNAGIWILQDKFQNNKGIIKVGHRHVDHLRAALTMIDSIDKTPVIVRSLGVSGILKKAEKKYLTN